MSTVPTPRRRTAPAPLTLVGDDFTLPVPPSVFEIEGFRAWATADDFPERLRVTFLNGEIILDMSNEEINSHVAVKTAIGGVLYPLVKAEKLGKFYGDGVLFSHPEAGVSN